MRRSRSSASARRIRRGRPATLVAVAALCLNGQSGLAAQSGSGDETGLQRFSGRDFGGLQVPAAPQEHAPVFRGARVWSWSEGATNRLLLERDVEVTIGPYSFRARRAVVWIEPVMLRDAATGESVPGNQVAVYFDRVSTPGAPAPAAPSDHEADRLLVTAVVFGSPVRLKADILNPGRPQGSALLDQAEARFARYLDALVRPPEAPVPTEVRRSSEPEATEEAAPPVAEAPRQPVEARDGLPSEAARPAPEPERTALDIPEAFPDTRPPLPPAERVAPIIPERGSITFFAGDVSVVDLPPDGEESKDVRAAALLGGEGGVVVSFQSLDALTHVQLSARRAVVFFGPGADPSKFRYRAQDVTGIYLEGNVIATASSTGAPAGGAEALDLGVPRGRYTLRGARVFFEPQTQRAVVLDAVFWTYDEERGMPLYLRAEAIRQTAENQWQAHDATLANVAFAEPHFSIGVTDVTLTNRADARGRTKTYVEAENVRFRAGDVPLAYLPRVAGELRTTPLRRLEFESMDGDPVLRSAWDLYSIFGIDAGPDNGWELLLDGYFDRGLALGTALDWNASDMGGSLFAYTIRDDGTDQLTSGAERDHDDEQRGMVLADNIWRVSEHWTLFFDFAYVSDETFVDAFFDDLAETRREFASSFYARRIEGQEGFTFEVRGTLNDFIPNEYLVQSLGYQTEKLPEAAYYLTGLDMLNGLLTYTGEARLSSMGLSFSEPTAAELGFNTERRSRAAFGLLPSQSIADRLRELGMSEETVNRFDTRHELELPLTAGPNGAVNIVPFMAGRFTAWDEDFDEFSGTDHDPYRAWGSAGIRTSTSFVRVNDAARSRFFDVDRLRHIIDPSATVWYSDASIEQADLPIYDDDVESLATGTAFRAGVRNTWQTYRAGRSTDFFVLNTDHVWSSGEVDFESPFGRFIEARPELSNLGRFLNNDAVWHVTDAFAATGGWLFDTQEGRSARYTVGALIDHGEGFSTFIESRYLAELASTFIDMGVRYELSRKYAAAVYGVYDLELDEFQSVGWRIARRFPQWTVEAGFSFDEITDEVSFGFSFRPVGFSGEDRSRILTRDPAPLVRTPESGAAPHPTATRLDSGPFKD